MDIILTKSVIIDTSQFMAPHVVANLRKRQNGKCNFCATDFIKGDIIIGSGHPRSYYHKSCAEKLNIL
jgi:hypothetical protein